MEPFFANDTPFQPNPMFKRNSVANRFSLSLICRVHFGMFVWVIPRHTSLLLRSEIPSDMRAKLRTVAASNNGDHARNLSSRTLVIMFNRSHVNIGRASTLQSLLLLLARATHVMVLFFTHIPFVVNHTINATPPERLQHCLPYPLGKRTVLAHALWSFLC